MVNDTSLLIIPLLCAVDPRFFTVDTHSDPLSVLLFISTIRMATNHTTVNG